MTDLHFIRKSQMPGAPLSEVLGANRDLTMLINRRNEAFETWVNLLISKSFPVDPAHWLQVEGPVCGLSPLVTVYWCLPKVFFPNDDSIEFFLGSIPAQQKAVLTKRAAQLVVDCTPCVKGFIDPIFQQDNRRDEDKHALIAPKAKPRGKIF